SRSFHIAQVEALPDPVDRRSGRTRHHEAAAAATEAGCPARLSRQSQARCGELVVSTPEAARPAWFPECAVGRAGRQNSIRTVALSPRRYPGGAAITRRPHRCRVPAGGVRRGKATV